jgi:predicted nucleic acid-binding protein
MVVDASACYLALADDGLPGEQARWRLRGHDLQAPHLVDLEVLSVLRREALRGGLTPSRADEAAADLGRLVMRRFTHGPLAPRIWALRGNLTPYDAAYVALAEALETPLLTADRRLASAPGLRCTVDLLPA